MFYLTLYFCAARYFYLFITKQASSNYPHYPSSVENPTQVFRVIYKKNRLALFRLGSVLTRENIHMLGKINEKRTKYFSLHVVRVLVNVCWVSPLMLILPCLIVLCVVRSSTYSTVYGWQLNIPVSVCRHK